MCGPGIGIQGGRQPETGSAVSPLICIAADVFGVEGRRRRVRLRLILEDCVKKDLVGVE